MRMRLTTINDSRPLPAAGHRHRVRSLIIKLDGRGGQVYPTGEGQRQGNKLRAGTVLQNGRITEAAIPIGPVRHAIRIGIIGVDRYDLPQLLYSIRYSTFIEM